MSEIDDTQNHPGDNMEPKQEKTRPASVPSYRALRDGEAVNYHPVEAINIALTMDLLKDLDTKLKEAGELSDAQAEIFEQTMKVLADTRFSNDATVRRMEQEDASTWTQKPGHDGSQPIRIVSSRLNTETLLSQTTIRGKRAVNLINSINSNGLSTCIPLWNSGIVIWIENMRVTDKVMLINEILNLNRSLGQSMGRSLYSAHDSVINSAVLDWVLDFVTTSSLKTSDKETLKRHILVDDIMTIMAGALQCLYPNGYPLNYRCINTLTGQCDYSVPVLTPDNKFNAGGLLEPAKTLWVNTKDVTSDDYDVMGANQNTVTIEQVIEYQNRRNKINRRVVVIDRPEDSRVVAVLKQPSLYDYETKSKRWITAVEELTNRLLAKANIEDSRAARQRAITKTANILQAYDNMGWIDHFEINTWDHNLGEWHTVKTEEGDMDACEGVVESFVTVEEQIDALKKGIEEFKATSTISVIGLSNFTCPKCNSGQTKDDHKHPSLIPVNLVSYFFMIGEYLLRKMAADR